MTVHEALHFFAGQAEGRAPPEAVRGDRARLPAPGPVGHHALGRRGAARQAGRAPGARGPASGSLYVLDEPTTGLHMARRRRAAGLLPAAAGGRGHAARHRAQHGRREAGRLGHRPRARGRRRRAASSSSRARPRRWPLTGGAARRATCARALNARRAAASRPATRGIVLRDRIRSDVAAADIRRSGRRRPLSERGDRMIRGAVAVGLVALLPGRALPPRRSRVLRRPGRQPEEPERGARARRRRPRSGRAGGARRWRRWPRSCATPRSRCGWRSCARCASCATVAAVPALVTLARRRRARDPRGGDRHPGGDLRRDASAAARWAASSSSSRTSSTAPRSPPYVDGRPVRATRRWREALRDEDARHPRGGGLRAGHPGRRRPVRELADARSRIPSPTVRAAAATAIGKVGTAEDGRALIPLLADESRDVRNRVLQALGVLRVTEAGRPCASSYEANRRKELRAAGPRRAEPHRRPGAGRPVPAAGPGAAIPSASGWRSRAWAASPTRRGCPPSRRTTSASATTSCGWPTASR